MRALEMCTDAFAERIRGQGKDKVDPLMVGKTQRGG